MYNYYLDGKDHYAADREASKQALVSRSQDDDDNPSGFNVPEYFREPEVLRLDNH